MSAGRKRVSAIAIEMWFVSSVLPSEVPIAPALPSRHMLTARVDGCCCSRSPDGEDRSRLAACKARSLSCSILSSAALTCNPEPTLQTQQPHAQQSQIASRWSWARAGRLCDRTRNTEAQSCAIHRALTHPLHCCSNLWKAQGCCETVNNPTDA